MEQTIAPKGVRAAKDIQQRSNQALSRYQQFKSDASRSKRDKLEDSRRFQYFTPEADELDSWIFGKLQAASNESYSGPTNFQAKIQKHQVFEAEVAAHSDAIVSLDNTGHEMIKEGHLASEVIQKRLEELHRLWDLLLSRLADKGVKVPKALILVQFLRQCDEVMFWIHDKGTFVPSDEFGSDLEHVGVLQCKFDEFQKDMADQEFRVTEVLLDLTDRLVNGHPEVETINRRKEELKESWQRLRLLVLNRQEKLFEAHEIQRFNCDADETVTWITVNDVVLSSDDLGLGEEKIKALDEFASKFIEGQHYGEDVAQRRTLLLDRREALLEKSSQRRALPDDSFRPQQFERYCDETKGWINEKLKFATDNSYYLDPTNLNGKVQKHQTFEQELSANKSRIEELDSFSRELVEANHLATDRILARLEEIVRLWETLLAATERKANLLAQASQQQQFNRDVEDLEIWLSEVEGQLLNEDCGKDLTSVQNLQKKHALLEADVASHQDRMNAIKSAAQQIIDTRHFDVDSILAKQSGVTERYEALQNPMGLRKQRLLDSLRVQQLFRDVEDEEAWIRGKEPIAASTNRGRDLIGVQNLIKKHQGVLAEMHNHEPHFLAVCQTGFQMADDCHFAADKVRKRIQALTDHWVHLKDKFIQHKQDLEDSLQTQEFIKRKQYGALSKKLCCVPSIRNLSVKENSKENERAFVGVGEDKEPAKTEGNAHLKKRPGMTGSRQQLGSPTDNCKLARAQSVLLPLIAIFILVAHPVTAVQNELEKEDRINHFCTIAPPKAMEQQKFESPVPAVDKSHLYDNTTIGTLARSSTDSKLVSASMHGFKACAKSHQVTDQQIYEFYCITPAANNTTADSQTASSKLVRRAMMSWVKVFNNGLFRKNLTKTEIVQNTNWWIDAYIEAKEAIEDHPFYALLLISCFVTLVYYVVALFIRLLKLIFSYRVQMWNGILWLANNEEAQGIRNFLSTIIKRK